jgi:hypothetical protein
LKFSSLFKLIGALISGAAAFSLLRELLRDLFGDRASGQYIPIPVIPVPQPVDVNNAAVADRTVTVNVTMPNKELPPGTTTVAVEVIWFDLVVIGASGRSLHLSRTLHTQNLDIAPNNTVPITFTPPDNIDHVAVMVLSRIRISSGRDSKYRGACIVHVP